jgi:hypothetical protein
LTANETEEIDPFEKDADRIGFIGSGWILRVRSDGTE